MSFVFKFKFHLEELIGVPLFVGLAADQSDGDGGRLFIKLLHEEHDVSPSLPSANDVFVGFTTRFEMQ